MINTRTISFTSGKGGVGKTTLIANVARQFGLLGKKVLLLDGDLGMANVDLMFGVRAEKSIMDVVSEKCSFEEVILNVAPGVDLIPGGSGIYDFNRMTSFEKRSLLDSVQSFNGFYDYLMIDTASGIGDHVLFMNAAAQIPIVIVTPDAASITDAYALIKVLNKIHRVEKFFIVCNQVTDGLDGLNLFKRFNDVVDQFLFVGLEYLGSVPVDQLLKRSNLKNRMFSAQNQNSLAAIAISDIVTRLTHGPINVRNPSGLQFFWEQMVGAA
jgi:flagellar biosynthesis protein FlhG